MNGGKFVESLPMVSQPTHRQTAKPEVTWEPSKLIATKFFVPPPVLFGVPKNSLRRRK
jgi:hypothetical protein